MHFLGGGLRDCRAEGSNGRFTYGKLLPYLLSCQTAALRPRWTACGRRAPISSLSLKLVVERVDQKFLEGIELVVILLTHAPKFVQLEVEVD